MAEMKFQQIFFISVLTILVLGSSNGFASGREQATFKPPVDCVILLHGLARTSGSMEEMAKGLKEAGYYVINMDYPSRKHPVAELSQHVVTEALQECRRASITRIHFVTHSLGGILVRYYLSEKTIPDLGRVVMLSPPNQGSEVVDKLKTFPGFYWLNGPAGQELGTDENSVPLKLGAVRFELGVITGNRSINLILSMLIPGDDDGKVSIESARVSGMADFLVLPHTHTFIMDSKTVIEQTLQFIRNGRFDHR